MRYPKVLERVDSPEQIFHLSFSLGAPEHNQRRNDSDEYAKLQRNEEHDNTKGVTQRREEQFSTG